MDEIRSLNDLKILNKSVDFLTSDLLIDKINDCLQKISFTIQDFNNVLKTENFEYKEIVFLLLSAVWVQESIERIEECYQTDKIHGFNLWDEEMLNAKKYINAIRSFVISHPLSTDRHAYFGFDGDLICVDVRTKSIVIPIIRDNELTYIDINGKHQGRSDKTDYYLYAYSKSQDNMKYFKYIGCSTKDLVYVMKLYLDKIYQFDDFIFNQTQHKEA